MGRSQRAAPRLSDLCARLRGRGLPAESRYGFHQYVALIMKMLSALACISRSSERWKAKSPMSSTSCRVWVHTKNSVEPGRYSQRSTALPRSDRRLKSGSEGAAVGVKSKVRG